MTRLLDPIERGEARAENLAAERVRGDDYTCFCGRVVPLGDCHTLSPDPYSPPVCGFCLEEALDGLR